MSVLTIQHEDDCPPALLGTWLAEAGVALDVRRPYAGDELPADLSGHDGLLVLGGPMGADDDATHPWLAPTKALLRDAVAREVPTLGVCLGHQLLASALGGTVTRNPRGTQRGLLDVGWTPSAQDDELLGTLATPRRGLQWNDDLVATLPPAAVVLAETPDGELQAARYGRRAWGVQLHPEVDESVVGAWARTSPEAGPLVDAVRTARDELETAWRPLAHALAALLP